MFAAGLGTKRDYEAAASWFTKAAEGGYPYAQYSLAKLYSEGQGVEQNYVKAFQLYDQSAAKGFPYAAWELGKRYRDGVGTEPDGRQSAWYFSAAFRGFKVLESQNHDGAVQYRIGWMLLHGVGSECDEAAARKWFEKAARSGNENAQYQLAKLALDSAGSSPEEISQAMDWLIKAAEAGSAHAQYTLGKLYRDGGPIEPNPVQAAIWFSQAAESGLRLKSISRYPPVSSSKLHPLYPGRSGKTMSGTEKKRMLFYETFFRLGLDSSEVIPPQSFHPEPTAPRIFWRWRCRSSEPKYFLSAPFR